MDILSRKARKKIIYSPTLLAKVTSVARSKQSKTSKLTAEEVTELEGTEHRDFAAGNWFMFKGRQMCVTAPRTDDGSSVLFAL